MRKILSELRLFNPHLILLDINLSGCDGREICRQTKSADCPFKNIPVVLFSADYNLKDNYAQAKADDFISKPFDAIELIQRLKKIWWMDELNTQPSQQSYYKATCKPE